MLTMVHRPINYTQEQPVIRIESDRVYKLETSELFTSFTELK